MKSILVHTKILNPEIKFKRETWKAVKDRQYEQELSAQRIPFAGSPASLPLCAPGHREARPPQKHADKGGKPAQDEWRNKVGGILLFPQVESHLFILIRGRIALSLSLPIGHGGRESASAPI